MDLVSRKEALAKGLKRYFTGATCAKGHKAERSVGTSMCLECDRIRQNKNQDRFRQRKNKYFKQYAKDNPTYRLFHSAKYRAKKTGVPFALVLSDITIPAVCPVLGVPFTSKGRFAASVGRLIPSIGYVKGNVNVVSAIANRIKTDASPEELEAVANWVRAKLGWLA